MFRNHPFLVDRHLVHRRVFVFIAAFMAFAVGFASPTKVQARDLRDLDSHLRIYLPGVTNRFPGCKHESSPSAFGVQMYGDTGSSSPYYPALLESGADWVRAPIYWESVEPQNVLPSAYNWSAADAVVRAATEACLSLIVTHERAPSWAATYTNGEIDKVSLDEFKQYMTALVERYDGDGNADAPGSPIVNYWELYNEPDAGDLLTHTTWGTKGAKYAQMLASVYDAIKEANPNAQVLLGGLAYDWFTDDPENPGPFVRSFLDDVLNNDGGRYFDIMNIHAYPAFAREWTDTGGPGLREKIEFVRNKLQNEYGLLKPFMVTEAGWHSNAYFENSSTPENQSRYVAQLYTHSLAAGVEVMIYWMLYDPGNGYPYESGLIANVNDTQSPPIQKPAFKAYQVVRSLLSNATFERPLNQSEMKAPEMEAYLFSDSANNRSIYIAWLNPLDSSEIESLRLPFDNGTVWDIYGHATEVVDIDDGSNDDRIKIQVTSKPVYIIVNH